MLLSERAKKLGYGLTEVSGSYDEAFLEGLEKGVVEQEGFDKGLRDKLEEVYGEVGGRVDIISWKHPLSVEKVEELQSQIGGFTAKMRVGI